MNTATIAEVFIAGRKAMYFGRDGDFYTEPFPAAK
jgi:hypothetical protein